MRVFISRTLSSESIFRNLLESKGFEVTGISMVQLIGLPFSTIPSCDWIFFSSKNAVKFFFENFSAKEGTPKVKWAAIGPATAKELSTHCPQIDFTGTGDPEETANLFREIGTGKTVLFPSARHSSSGVQRFLPETVHCLKLDIYDNAPLPDPALRTDDFLAFTSPMSAEAYFSKHILQKKQRVIAIGKSTFSTLEALGITRISMSTETSEQAMAEAVLRLLT